jgi:predicted nucleotidyltransferase
MKREAATKKLVRMLEAIESGQVPVNVREFYVFGSYARGSLEPNDLDLLLFYDGGEALNKRIAAELEAKGHAISDIIQKGARRFQAEVRRSLCRPGQRIDLTIRPHDPSGPNKFENEHIQHGKVLLWSQEDRNWRAKLAAILPNPAAGRFERGHFFPLRRLNASLAEMEAVTELLSSGQLVLTRIPVGQIDPKVSARHQHWIDHWSRANRCGKETRKLVPYAFWWLERHRQRFDGKKPGCWMDATSVSTGAYRVLMGSPSLHGMQAALQRAGTKQVCLIPHLKRAGPNELLVFERGPNWRHSS